MQETAAALAFAGFLGSPEGVFRLGKFAERCIDFGWRKERAHFPGGPGLAFADEVMPRWP